ncbi:hypothetical protein Hanom_Chr11g01063201 [Helianthus anomalus]
MSYRTHYRTFADINEQTEFLVRVRSFIKQTSCRRFNEALDLTNHSITITETQKIKISFTYLQEETRDFFGHPSTSNYLPATLPREIAESE